MRKMRFNLILAADSYKLSHSYLFPNDIDGMHAYLEARVKGMTIIPFGMQMFLKDYLSDPITMEDIDEAEDFAKLHGEPFDRSGWEHILNEYSGWLPLVIRAIPEGMPVPSQTPLYTIECDDPKVFWLPAFIETIIQRGIWYPTTIATRDYHTKKRMLERYKATGADVSALQFALHDFAGRGVTCREQACIGGAAHLVNFMGSDTMDGIRTANFYYNSEMAGFSVIATEHSIECSFGRDPENEIEYLKTAIQTAKDQGKGIVSIVIDGYDMYRAARALCHELRDFIIESGVKVVFRPDSGDMMETVPWIIALQAETFGYDINDAGFKKVRHVGVIQGDGVDEESIVALLKKLADAGFAADNLVFGSGGWLLQKVDRDKYRVAQKTSAVRKNGNWISSVKDPITDPGKKSKAGRLSVARHLISGEICTYDIDTGLDLNVFEDIMELRYQNGEIFGDTTLEVIRERAAQ